MPEAIRILIVDDHAVVRKGLAMVLRLEADFEVVGEAGDGQIGVELASTLQPDLVLIDLMMPKMDGAAATRAIRKILPAARILILTGAELDERLPDTLAAGADGYILKDIEPEGLKEAIRAVARGEAYLHPAVARMLVERTAGLSKPEPRARLTQRELEILGWMATPMTYNEIASRLVLSEETIRSHAKHVLRKLGQPNRVQAVLAAVRLGYIELPPEND
ncbi:MAG TPA: response regulator transcription factor [Anaerolineales bacterium]|nr:response regulator transcription factor [Anaerolineales bacterium]